IARDHDFLVTLDVLGGVGAGRAGLSGAQLFKDDLAGAAAADGAAHSSQHADHVEVRGIQREIAGHQKLGDTQKDTAGANQSGAGRQPNPTQHPYMAQVDQKVPRPAEPGQKDGDAHGIEKREVHAMRSLSGMAAAVMSGSVSSAGMPTEMKVTVRKVK